MSKTDEKLVDEEPKDEQTAKFLHKLAENGKERKFPDCLVAHYEKQAWEACKSDEKHRCCAKCGMPPPPPIEKNCEHVNEKDIGLEKEIREKSKKEESLKKQEQRKSLKRAAEKEEEARQPPRQMPRKVVPQVAKMERERAAARQKAAEQARLQTLQKSNNQKKKAKLVVEKEPEFLQKLFGIGANPV
ncbi:Protein CBG01124 [Caenorhabditis briggsae]|uniref:Protein CBG01124 n=2 Tax=Caenorhabditis briggsae TaxID=6238 RepID=A8WPM0_CAEBR|nr:Protein CBG01124 [Caenorhabditis briggsae]ULT87553.1 hypothetical protein L3Y34_007007 [Caenorhabditis briggsae]CAP22427.1 Protein CBG01124 [Caenorhabditis briggsae]